MYLLYMHVVTQKKIRELDFLFELVFPSDDGAFNTDPQVHPKKAMYTF